LLADLGHLMLDLEQKSNVPLLFGFVWRRRSLQIRVELPALMVAVAWEFDLELGAAVAGDGE
jgi:hypothetical protein